MGILKSNFFISTLTHCDDLKSDKITIRFVENTNINRKSGHTMYFN